MSTDPIRRRPMLWISAAALIVAAIVTVTVVSRPDDDSAILDDVSTITTVAVTTTAATSSTEIAATTEPATTAAPVTTEPAMVSRSIDELPEVVPLEQVGAETIASLDRPMQLTTDGTTVWVAQDSGPVVGFDATTGQQTVTLDVVNGEHALRPIVGFGSLWVLTEVGNQLRRFDPESGTLQAALDLPGLVGGQDPHLAATDEAVYVLIQEDGPTLATIDPATTTITNRVPLSSTTYHISADSERVYGFSLGSATIIDPATGRQDPQRTAAQATATISAFDSLWALTGTGGQVLQRFDAATLERLAEFDLTPVGLNYVASAATNDALWILTTSSFMEVDPTSNAVVARYGPPTGGGALVATPSALWFTDWNNGTVGRIPLPIAGG